MFKERTGHTEELPGGRHRQALGKPERNAVHRKGDTMGMARAGNWLPSPTARHHYCTYDNPLSAACVSNAVGYDDYPEAMQIFTDRVQEQIRLVKAEQE